MSILDDLTSGDPHKIWSGSCAVRDVHDRDALRQLAASIHVIRQKTEGVALGGALRPNSSHLKFALRKLEFVRDSSECLCRLYREDDLFSPKREEGFGAVRIIRRVHNGDYLDYYVCECVACGRAYRASEREYHYTWWQWSDEQNDDL